MCASLTAFPRGLNSISKLARNELIPWIAVFLHILGGNLLLPIQQGFLFFFLWEVEAYTCQKICWFEQKSHGNTWVMLLLSFLIIFNRCCGLLEITFIPRLHKLYFKYLKLCRFLEYFKVLVQLSVVFFFLIIFLMCCLFLCLQKMYLLELGSSFSISEIFSLRLLQDVLRLRKNKYKDGTYPSH